MESPAVHAIMAAVQHDAPQTAALMAKTLQLYGQPFVLPDSAYWYSAASTQPGKPARDTLNAGRITLIVPVSHNCGEACYPQYAALRRIHDRYASQRFDIVLMDNTAGYSPGSGVQTPDQEAAAARNYFFDFLKLPASALMVEVTPFTRRQDGTRVNGQTEFDERYATPTPVGPLRPAALLVGPDGTLRWIALLGTPWDGSIETLVDLSVRPLLEQPI
jgi:hypothetical protein